MGYKFNPFTGTFDITEGAKYSLLNLKGTVSTASALPAGATLGDVYQTADLKEFHVWDGANWDNLGTLTSGSGVTDGDKGDITVTNGGNTWTVDAGTINTQKLGGDITTAGKALLDDADAAAQRTTLGLGDSATRSVGTTAGTVAAGDDSRITGALQASTAATTYQPLDSDLTAIAALSTTSFGRSLLTQADAAAARTTLGAGTGNGTVTAVTGTAPIVSSGGATPAISISAATTSAAGSMSAADKTKLDGIAAGAEVNVNADWNAVSGDAQILNKPTLGTAAALNVGTSANNVVQLDGSGRLPAVDGSQLTNLPGGGGGGGSGTVTSVGLSLPGIFTVSGSPVTTTGTLTAALANQSANVVLAGPSSGSAAAPTFRALVNADLPSSISLSTIAATTELTLPSGAPGSPTARDLYAVVDTLRYRDSANAERLLLNSTDNLANLANTGTARTNLGLGNSATRNVGTTSTTVAQGNAGMPTGGTTGQVLTKSSATDYDAQWTTPTGGGGTAPNYQEFTSNGTWTKPAGCTFLYVEVISGGGGGGSGRRGAAGSVRNGGGGGPSGKFVSRWMPASLAGTTESITVGAGGTGAAGRTIDDTVGQQGTAGGSSSFGSLVIAGQTFAGQGGSNSGTTGGGAIQFWGGTSQTTLAGIYGAAGGNSGLNGAAGAAGNRSAYAPGSGGGGGGITTADAASNGGAGGQGFAEQRNTVASSQLGGGGGAAGTSGGNGGDGTADGDGGGGGASSTTAAAGNGGNGAFPGGGGGGGGASLNGFNSGAGGNGGAGVVRVWAW